MGQHDVITQVTFPTPSIPASGAGAAPLMAVAAQVSLREVVLGVMNNAPHVLVTSVHQEKQNQSWLRMPDEESPSHQSLLPLL